MPSRQGLSQWLSGPPVTSHYDDTLKPTFTSANREADTKDSTLSSRTHCEQHSVTLCGAEGVLGIHLMVHTPGVYGCSGVPLHLTPKYELK